MTDSGRFLFGYRLRRSRRVGAALYCLILAGCGIVGGGESSSFTIRAGDFEATAVETLPSIKDPIVGVAGGSFVVVGGIDDGADVVSSNAFVASEDGVFAAAGSGPSLWGGSSAVSRDGLVVVGARTGPLSVVNSGLVHTVHETQSWEATVVADLQVPLLGVRVANGRAVVWAQDAMYVVDLETASTLQVQLPTSVSPFDEFMSVVFDGGRALFVRAEGVYSASADTGEAALIESVGGASNVSLVQLADRAVALAQDPSSDEVLLLELDEIATLDGQEISELKGHLVLPALGAAMDDGSTFVLTSAGGGALFCPDGSVVVDSIASEVARGFVAPVAAGSGVLVVGSGPGTTAEVSGSELLAVSCTD